MRYRDNKQALVRWGRLLLLWVLFAQMLTSAMVKSPAYDEMAHVFRGCLVWRYDYRSGRPIHRVSGALCRLAPELPAFDEPPAAQVRYRNAFFNALDFHVEVLLFPARVVVMLLTVLLGALLYRWGEDISPGWGGMVTLALLAFEPNVLAHGRLVTTDLATTLLFTLCLYCYTHALRRRALGYFAATLGALWLALLNKPTALVLAPLLVLMTLTQLNYKRGWKSLALQLSAFVGLAILGTGVYGLMSGAYVPGEPFWRIFQPLPRRVLSVLARLLAGPAEARGWPAYMLGKRSFQGWWYYFLLLFVVKTPLPLLIAALVGAGQLVRARKWTLLAALSLPVWMLIAYTRLALNIGYRHLLPIVPALVVLAAYALGQAQGKWPRWGRAVCVLWLGLGSLRVYPDYLAYFNEIAGGPGGGINFFTDSNLDWGQDLKGLRRWLDARGISQVYMSYFGDVDPEVYGIEYLPLTSQFGRVYESGFTPMHPAPGIYALSATNLTGQYLWENPTVFSWFMQRDPVARIGHTIWVFDVLPDPEPPRWAAVCAPPGAPSPVYILEGQLPLDFVEELRSGVGDDPPLSRWVSSFDCSRGWPLAREEDGPAWLLVPSLDQQTPAFLPPVGAYTRAYRQEDFNNQLLYEVFRWQPEVGRTGLDFAVQAGGELALEHVDVSVREAVRPGDSVALTVVWRVLTLPTRPVSFMAHLHAPDNRAVAVDDGNAIPLGTWKTGDRLMQMHQLPLPADAPPGRYAVVLGVYTVPEIEHLPFTSEEGTVLGPTLVGAEFEVR